MIGNQRMADRAAEDLTDGIVGLGYVGLPLAVAFADAGLSVLGVDSDPERVGRIRAGTSPINDVSDEQLQAAFGRGLRIAELSDAAVRACDVVFVCVPTPIDAAKNPDLTAVRSAAATIARGLRKGHLIVLQSTTSPGTTTGPFREELERSGLVAGLDFDLAYAPRSASIRASRAPAAPTSHGSSAAPRPLRRRARHASSSGSRTVS
jgi:UDP-N-acetyl-D-glucosamine dehydrogenase